MTYLQHAAVSRRAAVQAGAIGLLGLGMNHLEPLRAAAASTEPVAGAAGSNGAGKAKSVIYIFLSGGLSQLDSFDMKPDAPESVRGEFQPIDTATPGIQICEHLPLLAAQSNKWALCRSMAHNQPEHSTGHLLMMTGRHILPPGFDPSKPKPSDWPSLTSVANAVTAPRNNLPPSVMLPETLIHRTGRVIPGQFAGEMGAHHDPMILELCRYNPTSYGAYPTHTFHHAQLDPAKLDGFKFQAPNLSLPSDMTTARFEDRMALRQLLSQQRRDLEHAAANVTFDRHRQRAISLLADASVQQAFDVTHADSKTQDRYGRNTFGWSLLLACQLIEAGVNLVQVNLGNNETWDTHGNIFPHLKQYLFPPTDQAVSALIDDLDQRGLLDDTLVVMAGEMGRTPRVFGGGTSTYKHPGRDHWGTQSVFFAGGGVKGGQVIGSTDKIGAYPKTQEMNPSNLGATIYQGLGLPRETHYRDRSGRPHFIYHADPIRGLT
jgi:hypothetical protein